MADIITYRGQTFRVGGDPLYQPRPLPDWIPDLLPAGWQEHQPPYGWDRDYNRVYERHGTIRVLLSCAQYGDGKVWVHLSVSRKNREIPTWSLMSEIKELFLGTERTAYQVHPPRSKHVNIHPGVLHLYCCVDGPVTPDFTGGGDTI